MNGLAFPAGDAGARAWAESRGWDSELDRLDPSYREVIAGSHGRAERPVVHAA